MHVLFTTEVDPRPPPIIHQGPQNQTLPINTLAMLQCTSSGDPPPSIRWLKDDRTLPIRDPRITLLDSGTLQISSECELGIMVNGILRTLWTNLVSKLAVYRKFLSSFLRWGSVWAVRPLRRICLKGILRFIEILHEMKVGFNCRFEKNRYWYVHM